MNKEWKEYRKLKDPYEKLNKLKKMLLDDKKKQEKLKKNLVEGLIAMDQKLEKLSISLSNIKTGIKDYPKP